MPFFQLTINGSRKEKKGKKGEKSALSHTPKELIVKFNLSLLHQYGVTKVDLILKKHKQKPIALTACQSGRKRTTMPITT